MEKKKLVDKYGRQLNYLRVSVTDRCNFRCYYCMPEEGILFSERKELLSFDELQQLITIFTNLGITKIRVTGGEPFVRKGIIPFLAQLTGTIKSNEISITTNGSLTTSHILTLKALGITKINVSLDSLNKERFQQITKRDSFNEVYNCITTFLNEGFDVKLNSVITNKESLDEVLPFIELTKTHQLVVRFLEAMPFNGKDSFEIPSVDYRDIYNYISKTYDTVIALDNEANSTSVNYCIPGYKGSFGIIPSFSRTFCGTCNRIRLSATGELRTCLYGPPVCNLRDLLRAGATTEEIENQIIEAVAGRAKDGFEAEAKAHATTNKSMAVLGG